MSKGFQHVVGTPEFDLSCACRNFTIGRIPKAWRTEPLPKGQAGPCMIHIHYGSKYHCIIYIFSMSFEGIGFYLGGCFPCT